MNNLPNIYDVARYVFERYTKEQNSNSISQMVLYKLLWFCQGWHYHINDGEPLFNESFNAWTYGPMPLSLWSIFQGEIYLTSKYFESMGDLKKINKKSIMVIDKVLKNYGNLTASKLSYLSHQCKPWIDHYDSSLLFPGNEIPNDEIKSYFIGL